MIYGPGRPRTACRTCKSQKVSPQLLQQISLDFLSNISRSDALENDHSAGAARDYGMNAFMKRIRLSLDVARSRDICLSAPSRLSTHHRGLLIPHNLQFNQVPRTSFVVEFPRPSCRLLSKSISATSINQPSSSTRGVFSSRWHQKPPTHILC